MLSVDDLQQPPSRMDAGAVIGLGKDDIDSDHKGSAPEARPGLMDTGAEGLTGWAAKRAAQQDR